MQELLPPIAVFFDMDGTLVDSYPFLLAAHNHVREAFGQRLFTMEEYLPMMARTTREVYAELYGDKAEDAKKILYAFVNENQSRRVVPMTGAVRVLDFLKGRGVALGVVSNMAPDPLRALVGNLGWTEYFGKAVVGAGDAQRPKPAADPILLAAERAGINFDPARVWMVGDTEADVASAKAAGCVSVLVNFRRDCGKIIEALKPDFVIEKFHEIEAFL